MRELLWSLQDVLLMFQWENQHILLEAQLGW